MTLPPAPDRWTIELENADRKDAIEAFGFTDRHARFLLQVLLHSGVFVERHYVEPAIMWSSMSWTPPDGEIRLTMSVSA